MNLILLGPPGAGKGTLAGYIKESLGILHISTGDILREEIKNNTDLGIEAKGFIDKGELVPDDLVIKLIEKVLTKESNRKLGYMLDGFPRNESQAKKLDEILKKINKPIDQALYLDSPLPIVIKRLTGRRVCRKCGAVFHVTNRPPKKQNICDVCGGELYQREDDNEQTIKNRMEVYQNSTKPVVEFYKKKNILRTLDGDQESESLHDDLLKALNEDGKIH